MGDVVSVVLQQLFVVLGLAAVPNAATLGVAIAVLALATLALACVLVSAPAARSVLLPSRAIDVSVLPSQGDPDADGHPRPRAPGSAATA